MLGFFTVVCLFVGIAGLSIKGHGRLGVLGDSMALVFALVVLFSTADRWGRWVGGYIGFRVGLVSLIALIMGPDVHSRYTPLSREDAATALVYSVLVLILTFPLAISPRVMGRVDRTCLVGAVVACSFGVIAQSRLSVWIWMTVCLSLLVILRVRNGGKKRHLHVSNGPCAVKEVGADHD